MYWLWSLPLTLIVFFCAKAFNKRFAMTLFNPLLISMLVIIAILLLTKTPYQHYFQGSALINSLLQPTIVALAFPLYELLQQIRTRWKSVLSLCLLGSVVGMLSGTAIAFWLGATPEIAASVLPKSVTTPLAMAVAASIGGVPAISAVCVIFVGIVGSVLGHSLLNKLHISNTAARGLSMGCVAHALGTARCAELDYQESAFSSLALVICGIFTCVLGPLLFPLCVMLFGPA